MATLVLVALAGFAASFVDGALGMGFGPTSSSILLATGLAPAAVSTTVNLAKVVTGTAGGAAHWRFGNVDRRLVLQLAGPGVVGAVIGVTVLANVDGDRLRPYLSGLLLVVGLRIVLRFRRQAPATTSVAAAGAGPEAAPASASGQPMAPGRRAGIVVAAFAGGITNGLIGAWGPVVTPVLLSRDDVEPRVAIGSVNTAEIAVAVAASGSLLASLGGAGVDAGILVAMLVGGTLAAPVAAWAVRRIAPRQLGAGAGGLLLITSIRELGGSSIGLARWPIYAAVVATCLLVGRTSRGPAPAPAPVLGPPAPATLAEPA